MMSGTRYRPKFGTLARYHALQEYNKNDYYKRSIFHSHWDLLDKKQQIQSSRCSSAHVFYHMDMV